LLSLSEYRQLVVELPNGTRAMLEESWIGPGTVVATLDSAEPGRDLAEKSDLFVVDSRAQLQKELTELFGAEAPGWVDATVAEVVSGKHPGRTDEAQRVLIITQGMASQDVALANLVYQRALAKKLIWRCRSNCRRINRRSPVGPARYCTVVPPSSSTVCPVIYAACGVSKYRIRPATSAALPKRPAGMRASMRPWFDDKILLLYSRGMTVREIQSHPENMYVTEVSPTVISSVTDAVVDEVKNWQSNRL